MAEQGDAYAQSNLGLMYDSGQGVPQDDAEAVKWYRLAAEQSLAGAQFYLAAMYFHGRGVPRDYVQAQMWLNLAASLAPLGGTPDIAVDLRDKLAARITPEQIAEAQRLAREWKPE